QNRVVAGLVGLIERQQRRSDEDQDTVAINLRGLWRRHLDRRDLRLRRLRRRRARANKTTQDDCPNVPANSDHHQANVTPARLPMPPCAKPPPTPTLATA